MVKRLSRKYGIKRWPFRKNRAMMRNAGPPTSPSGQQAGWGSGGTQRGQRGGRDDLACFNVQEGASSMRFHPLNARRPSPPADLGTSQPSGSLGETSSGSRSSATPLSASFSEFTQSRRPGDACNSYKPAQGPRAPCAANPRSWERGSPAGAAGSNNLTELLAVPAIRDALHQMLGGQALASVLPRAQAQRAPQPAPSFGGRSAPSAVAIFRAAVAGRGPRPRYLAVDVASAAVPRRGCDARVPDPRAHAAQRPPAAGSQRRSLRLGLSARARARRDQPCRMRRGLRRPRGQHALSFYQCVPVLISRPPCRPCPLNRPLHPTPPALRCPSVAGHAAHVRRRRTSSTQFRGLSPACLFFSSLLPRVYHDCTSPTAPSVSTPVCGQAPLEPYYQCHSFYQDT